jgi:hypothetical protein
MTEDSIRRAHIEAVKFIKEMPSHELGIYTLRKAFEMGYLHGLNDNKHIKEEEDGI